MTHLSDVESKSANDRIAELRVELKALETEKAQRAAEEAEYRAKEDSVQRISFAKEIFDLHQDQLRLEVEAEFVRKKIRRLELGYAEDAVPETDTPDGFVF